MDSYLRADKDSGLMVIHSKITYAGEDYLRDLMQLDQSLKYRRIV